MPIPLAPFGIAVDGAGHQLRNKVRHALENRCPVLQDLRTANERAAGVQRLRAGVVLGEQRCHALGVMGVLRIPQPLQHRRNSPPASNQPPRAGVALGVCEGRQTVSAST